MVGFEIDMMVLIDISRDRNRGAGVMTNFFALAKLLIWANKSFVLCFDSLMDYSSIATRSL